MSVTYIKKSVLSSDKKHNLSGAIYLPEGRPKGIFHVVHGMTEHIVRYDDFMRKIAESGYICFGFDNLGHGYTANSDFELGFISQERGYEYLLEDVAVFSNAVKAQYGEDLPYYLLGHSMGSFVVRCFAAFNKAPDKLIIMGTAGKNPASKIGIELTKIIKKIYGDKHFSKLIDKMAFGPYNKRFKAENDEYSWLTKDKNVRDKYRNDKFCTFKFSISAMQDLFTLLSLSNSRQWYERISKELPILLLSGMDDPVGEYGKGVFSVYKKLKENAANVKIKLYENSRHEILNDTSKEEVIADILNFVQ